MKAIIPEQFFIFASQFSMDSIIKGISYWAQYTAANTDGEVPHFSRKEKYTIVNGKHHFTGTATIVQTWLIDILYKIICHGTSGVKEISKNETLHLIALYTEHADKTDAKYLRKHVNPFLYVMGFFGEQYRFQSASILFEEFSREKYILDELSYRSTSQNAPKIDVKKEFKEITGYFPLCLRVWQ